ncbi:MAG: hypothetical protein JWN76_2762 [Chitinophagaceae bacterium]|nr:hypothetical protein [Chitinophagaceae bacterium]
MNSSLKTLQLIFNLNEKLFLNSLEGVTDKSAKERISDKNNPMIWVATHTAWARFNIVTMLGAKTENPYAGRFEGFKPYQESDSFPPLEEIKNEWNKASKQLRDAIEKVTDEYLAADSAWKAPIGDNSNAGTIAFLAEHESYDIGQMGFLKKFHTGEAMKY